MYSAVINSIFGAAELADFNSTDQSCKISFFKFCGKQLKAVLGRSHVYSAFLLNLVQVEKQGLNFKQEIFVWEDLVFNLQAHDVVKSNRFAMVKQPFKTGGCSKMVARSANPFIRDPVMRKVHGGRSAQVAGGRGQPSAGPQDYAALSGCRFQGYAFESNGVTGKANAEEWKAAVQKAMPRVKEFRNLDFFKK
eukprot:s738_g10.t4